MVIDKSTKALVIAPHADDEAFGCGGTIAKLTSQGAWVYLIVVTMGYDYKLDNHKMRVNELGNSKDILGIQKCDYVYPGRDGYLDKVSQADMIREFDKILDEYHFDYLFFPYPSHHQDHIAVQSAVIAALRPGAHKVIPNILMYEYTYPSWSNDDTPKGRYYVEIPQRFMNRKTKAIESYQSQLRKFPHPVSVEAALALARVRGMAINVEYAEMFYVVQMVGEI
jgi:LmbE family N-acetylglucosaminyl deacetylase